MLLLVIACVEPRSAPAPVPNRPPRAVRLVIDDQEARLEVASRSLAREAREVALIGVVHVADPAFYDAVGALADTHATVLVEGLAPDPDAPPLPDDDVAEGLRALGLTLQRDALPMREGWRRSDLGVADLRRELVRRGVDPGPWLDDRDRGALRSVIASANDPRTRALARLALLSGLAGEPPADPVYDEVILGLRDLHVVDEVLAVDGPVAVVFGADHVPDLEARLAADGFARSGERWLAAIRVPYTEAGLGPVQARQLLHRVPEGAR